MISTTDIQERMLEAGGFLPDIHIRASTNGIEFSMFCQTELGQRIGCAVIVSPFELADFILERKIDMCVESMVDKLEELDI